MRKEKTLLLDQLAELIRGSQGYILTSFSGVKANEAYGLREALHASGAEWEIVRKRVFQLAAKSAGQPLEGTLQGSVGVVLVRGDFSEASKTLKEEIGKLQDRVAILGGWYEGAPCASAEVIKIAQLPTRDEMRAQLLAQMVAPMSQTVGAMNALLTSVPHCLQQKSEQAS